MTRVSDTFSIPHDELVAGVSGLTAITAIDLEFHNATFDFNLADPVI